MRPNATTMNTASPTVRRIAVTLTFHQGRLSSMSYARFIAETIATMAAELLHRAPSRPSVKIPPSFPFESRIS